MINVCKTCLPYSPACSHCSSIEYREQMRRMEMSNRPCCEVYRIERKYLDSINKGKSKYICGFCGKQWDKET